MNDNSPSVASREGATPAPPSTRVYDPHVWRLHALQAYTVAKLAAIVPTAEMLQALAAGTPGPRSEDQKVLEALHTIADYGRRLAADAKSVATRHGRPRAIDVAAAEGC